MAPSVKSIVILLTVFFSLSEPVTLFAAAKKQEPAPAVETRVVTDLQDRYDALAAPGAIMLPISGISAVSSSILADIEKELLRQLIESGRIKPVRMQRWLLSSYTNKANNPFVIMNAIKAEQYLLPLQYIGKPVVFRNGGQYYFVLYMYSLESYYPLIVFRQCSSLDTIEEMISSCIEELYIRLSQPASRGPGRRVVVDDFKLEFLRLVEHSSGEFDFITAPFLEVEGMTLREGDEFFSRMMGYILTTTGLFQTFQIGDFHEYSSAVVGSGSTLVDHRIQGRVQLSEHECILYVDVIEIRSGSRILSMRYPLLKYSFEEIWNAYRKMSVQIIKTLFDEEVYGIIPDLSSPGRSFFANNMFIGQNVLENFILAKGLHIISTGSNYGIEITGETGTEEGVGIEEEIGSVNTYYIILDKQSAIFTDTEGKHIWNLLTK